MSPSTGLALSSLDYTWRHILLCAEEEHPGYVAFQASRPAEHPSELLYSFSELRSP